DIGKLKLTNSQEIESIRGYKGTVAGFIRDIPLPLEEIYYLYSDQLEEIDKNTDLRNALGWQIKKYDIETQKLIQLNPKYKDTDEYKFREKEKEKKVNQFNLAHKKISR